MRQLLQDFRLVFLGQVFEDCDRVVGLELADALGHGLRRQFLKDLFPHRVVDLGERGKVEVDSEQLDEARPLFRFQRFDQRPHVGFVHTPDKLPQTGYIACFNPAADVLDESLADRAVLVARKLRSLGSTGLFLVQHARLSAMRLTRDACTPFPARGANDWPAKFMQLTHGLSGWSAPS